MNIQEAKDSIKDAVSAYLGKDAAGNYSIPRNRQRPIMVMGAPGLGKTAIMSQIAAEMGIGYVPYTITHHTRQSAIGLPTIETRTFGGVKHPVTRYTMSEIIASVYDAMESQGMSEGILFIDEVNCVSETLAPAMLDLLQNKKFGPHRIPEGWVLVAAGNPPEYNASAREFDIATMDRIRTIDVEPDTDIWLRYAVGAGVHDAVTYYLQVKPQNLLRVERTVNGSSFVTPRGWEDLSTVMKEYDRKGFTVDVGLISQYIHDPEIASEFKRYLDFHRRYSEDYDVGRILMTGEGDLESMSVAGAEEKLAVVSVMVGRINSEAEEGMDLVMLSDILSSISSDPTVSRESVLSDMRRRLDGNLTSDERRGIAFSMSAISEIGGSAEDMETLRRDTDTRLSEKKRDLDSHIVNAMEFLRRAFGDGQEMISLLVGLIGCYNVVLFSDPDGPLYGYNEELLTSRRDRRIADMLEAV